MKKCKCLRCDHEWYPRVPNGKPVMCPACKSRVWDKERKKAKKD